MLLEASVTGRKVQSEKTWAVVQPSLASDSRDRWASHSSMLMGFSGALAIRKRAGAGCPKLGGSSAQQEIKQLEGKEAHGGHK